jgi:hypothetical protein
MSNLTHVVPKDGSKASWSRVTPGGPIEVKLEEARWGWGPYRGTAISPAIGLPLCLYAHLQVPSFQNELLLRLALNVFVKP